MTSTSTSIIHSPHLPTAIPVPSQDAVDQTLHWDQSNASDLVVICIVSFCITAAATALRLVSRKLSKESLRADDWVLFVATGLTCACPCIVLVAVAQHDLGRHWVTLSQQQKRTAQSLEYIFILFRIFTYSATRIAIVLFYSRVFTERWIRVVCWFFLGFYLMYAVANCVSRAITTIPIRAYYSHIGPSSHAIDGLTLYIVDTGFNLAIDLSLIILPNFVLWTTPKERWQMLGLGFIFGLSLVTVTCEVMRLVHYLHLSVYDWSYTLAPYLKWTLAELLCSVVCASALAFQPLLRWILFGDAQPAEDPREASEFRRKRSSGEYSSGKEVVISVDTSITVERPPISDFGIFSIDEAVRFDPETIFTRPSSNNDAKQRQFSAAVCPHQQQGGFSDLSRRISSFSGASRSKASRSPSSTSQTRPKASRPSHRTRSVPDYRAHGRVHILPETTRKTSHPLVMENLHQKGRSRASSHRLLRLHSHSAVEVKTTPAASQADTLALASMFDPRISSVQGGRLAHVLGTHSDAEAVGPKAFSPAPASLIASPGRRNSSLVSLTFFNR